MLVSIAIAIAILLKCSIAIAIAILFSHSIGIGIAILFASIANNPAAALRKLDCYISVVRKRSTIANRLTTNGYCAL